MDARLILNIKLFRTDLILKSCPLNTIPFMNIQIMPVIGCIISASCYFQNVISSGLLADTLRSKLDRTPFLHSPREGAVLQHSTDPRITDWRATSFTQSTISRTLRYTHAESHAHALNGWRHILGNKRTENQQWTTRRGAQASKPIAYQGRMHGYRNNHKPCKCTISFSKK